jgi:extracellular elastinolytic metalloproteinase
MNSKLLKGNIVALQLLIGGLMLQPCNPSMIQARDAIFEADKAYYASQFECELWHGFAKRGLGLDAVEKAEGATEFKDGFLVPPTCQ